MQSVISADPTELVPGPSVLGRNSTSSSGMVAGRKVEASGVGAGERDWEALVVDRRNRYLRGGAGSNGGSGEANNSDGRGGFRSGSNYWEALIGNEARVADGIKK